MFEKQQYERPTVEVVEFELSDSIAESALSTSGLFGFEEIWGNE
ncbi:MAG: hypothetical protein RBQ91_05170 [Acholeplasma sp.]|nr:hypothetical protein [Acholeplasma sp.]